MESIKMIPILTYKWKLIVNHHLSSFALSPTLVGFFVCGMMIEFITSKMDLYNFLRFL